MEIYKKEVSSGRNSTITETKIYLADGWWIVQMMVRPSRANSCKTIITVMMKMMKMAD